MTIEEINKKVIEKSHIIDNLNDEIAKVVVGQRYMIKRMLVGLLADGHILLEGVPGLAKTLAVNTLANTIKASFKRLQFTPDLLPADLVGTLIYNQKTSEFVPKKGPIFANFILADEINRAPAKVQSALLEAMQERQVTIGDTTYPLEKPFLVMATQNPLEQEGTYPLPEAQVDRFMLKLIIDYPSRQEEEQIMDLMVRDDKIKIKPVIKPKEILEL
ncbi:MAG: ATPase, partial [Candidatus Cloacimonas sp. 4484_143]